MGDLLPESSAAGLGNECAHTCSATGAPWQKHQGAERTRTRRRHCDDARETLGHLLGYREGAGPGQGPARVNRKVSEQETSVWTPRQESGRARGLRPTTRCQQGSNCAFPKECHSPQWTPE